MEIKKRIFIYLIILFIITLNNNVMRAQVKSQIEDPPVEELFSKEKLTSDTRQLVDFLESIHPDPYMYSGGKVEFNRKFQNILQSIPSGGMTKDEYARLIRPFIASISDAHTRIATAYNYDKEQPGGLPFSLGSVEREIYVNGVYDKKDRKLIGARLISVEGVTLEQMMKRLYNLFGIENDYHCLIMLKDYLRIKPYLADIIPEWDGSDKIKLVLELEKGDLITLTKNTHINDRKDLIMPESKIPLPDLTRSDFNYVFLDRDKETALLKIDELTAYREMFESIANKKDISATAAAYYKRYNGKEAPDNFEEILEGIPSAADLFKDLLNEMKSAGTKNLIVDLSKNTGGNSLMSDILIYFLYGQDALVEIIKGTPSVKKLSSYYFEQNPGKSIDQLNREYSRIQSYQINENDYDFSTEKYINLATSGKIDIKTGLGIKYGGIKSFMQEIISGENNRIYTPENVFVTSSHNTFSSAFTFLRHLSISGASIVGSTSGQSGNGFGNLMYVSLSNTGIRLAISKDAYLVYPEVKGERKVLSPDYKLTYEMLKEYHFDPNSEIRYALKIFESMKE